MRNRKLSVFSYSWVVLIVLATACAPQRKDGVVADNARALVSMNKTNLRTSGLRGSGGDVALPDNYCFAVHVTGPGLIEMPPERMQCGPAVGYGSLSARAYNRGETADLTVKVGRRRFDLIGFKSPLGVTNGRANCGALSVEVQATDNDANHRLVLKVNGQAVAESPVIFATGEVDINPGDNNVSIEAVPKFDSPLVSALSFGAPYLRRDIPGAAPADLCGATSTTTTEPTPRVAQQLFVVPALVAPDPGPPTATPQLKALTTSPVMMVTPLTSNGVQLKTGLFEIEKTRR